LGDGVLLSDAGLLGDGVLISDGVLMSDGMLMSDSTIAQSVLSDGDDTSAMPLVIDTGVDYLGY
jgi:hypothetical protein